VLGDLDPTLVRHAFRDHAEDLRRCYRGTNSGQITAQFTIVPDGTVGKALVTGFDDAIAHCVCEVVAKMTFMPGATIVVTYPIVFRPAQPSGLP